MSQSNSVSENKSLVVLVYAAGGLGLYLVARFLNVDYDAGPHRIHLGGATTAITLVAVIGIPSLASCIAGMVLGARMPRLTAYLLQPWPLLMLCLGSAGGALGLDLLTGLVPRHETNTAPALKVGLDAGAAILSGAVGFGVGKFGAWGSSWLAKRFITAAYGPQFASQPMSDPKLTAYYAIRRDDFGLSGFGRVTGWGRRDTTTRLRAIKAAL